ncbi:hypothetical protein CMV_024016 [Castanea mollissima]|uniref:Uncharacterized protein n=1 Tax=Castanea mollissima TaxID=60419 RepID=A0A8J4QFJ7_9ROSI|nr:hypothetical protein CMV_024016 [Castanea mollissima]
MPSLFSSPPPAPIFFVSSLATDGPEETLSCLIHMAKLQDSSIKLDKEASDLLHGGLRAKKGCYPKLYVYS